LFSKFDYFFIEFTLAIKSFRPIFFIRWIEYIIWIMVSIPSVTIMMRQEELIN